MKKLIIFLTLALILIFELGISYAQSPDYIWAKSAGGTYSDYGFSVATDANGNILVTGIFVSPSITFGTTTLTNAGDGNMFIVKYDAGGNVLWAKSAGGIIGAEGNSVAIDVDGNIFVTGEFYDPYITFGTDTLTNAGSQNMFIVKYDVEGNVLWAKTADGSAVNSGSGVATDANGNILVTGEYYGSFITFGTDTLTNPGGANVYIVKYDNGGNILWAKTAGGAYPDGGGSGVATDSDGNIFVTGEYYGSFITFGTDTLTNAGESDMFIVEYDAGGNVLWAKSAGGIENDQGFGVATDSDGNIFVTGFIESDNITFGTDTLTNAGSADIFIVKYDAGGNVLWAKSAGGIENDDGFSVATDGDGNIFVTGFFASDTITFGTTTLTSAGSGDIFIVKYDADGNVLWAKRAGGTSFDRSISVTSDANGNVLLTGVFKSPTITFGTTTLTSEGGGDMFIAKIDNIVGIQENNFVDAINVFPNPVTDNLTIVINNFQFPINKLEIFDNTGKQVKSIKTTGQSKKYTINVEDLPAGLYLLKVTGDKGTEAMKFVKE